MVIMDHVNQHFRVDLAVGVNRTEHGEWPLRK